MQPQLTILEGKWFEGKNVTVLDLFKPLFTVWPPDERAGDRAYHYEMFNNEAAFVDAIRYAFRANSALTVYVAAHGTEEPKKAILGFRGNAIGRTIIRNALKSPDTNRRRGILFGSCSFGTEANARFILDSCGAVDWIAGYQETIDWVESTVLDLFFLKNYLYPSRRGRQGNPRSSAERLWFAVGKTAKQMGGLARDLGFSVYRRRKGPGSQIQNIMENSLESG